MPLGRSLATVWVDGWQLQCCGEPFAVGKTVSWTVIEPDLDFAAAVLGHDLAQTVTGHEEHHGGNSDDAAVIAGRVRSIRAAFCRYQPTVTGSMTLHPVPNSLWLVKKATADGREPDIANLKFVAYLVEV